jgi:hypothetical protein
MHIHLINVSSSLLTISISSQHTCGAAFCARKERRIDYHQGRTTRPRQNGSCQTKLRKNAQKPARANSDIARFLRASRVSMAARLDFDQKPPRRASRPRVRPNRRPGSADRLRALGPPPGMEKKVLLWSTNFCCSDVYSEARRLL